MPLTCPYLKEGETLKDGTVCTGTLVLIKYEEPLQYYTCPSCYRTWVSRLVMEAVRHTEKEDDVQSPD